MKDLFIISKVINPFWRLVCQLEMSAAERCLKNDYLAEK